MEKRRLPPSFQRRAGTTAGSASTTSSLTTYMWISRMLSEPEAGSADAYSRADAKPLLVASVARPSAATVSGRPNSAVAIAKLAAELTLKGIFIAVAPERMDFLTRKPRKARHKP